MKGEDNFEKIAQMQRASSFIGELWVLICEHQKYWAIPIVIVLLLFGILVSLSGTAVAPFIYTLF